MSHVGHFCAEVLLLNDFSHVRDCVKHWSTASDAVIACKLQWMARYRFIMSGVAHFEMINYERCYSYRVPWKWDHEVRRCPPRPESPSDRFRRPRGHSMRTYKSFFAVTWKRWKLISCQNTPKLISWGVFITSVTNIYKRSFLQISRKYLHKPLNLRNSFRLWHLSRLQVFA